MSIARKPALVRRLALGAAMLCGGAAPALAQSAADPAPSWMERRVDGLERGLAFFGGREERAPQTYVQPAQSSSLADIAVRLDRLENQMRQLNGRIEEMQFQVKRNDDALKRFQGDVDFRIQDLESGKAGGASKSRRGDAGESSSTSGASRSSDSSLGAPPSTLGASRSGDGDSIGGLIDEPGDDPNAPMSIRPPGVGRDSGDAGRMASRDAGSYGGVTAGTGSARDQFDLGVGFVQRRDYGQAEATFRDFISQNPKDAKVPEARYWLGESFYQRKKYTDAADAFLTTYRDSPQSPKAPESMLKLGMSLNGMGEKEQACATIAEAGRKYSRIKAQSDRELKRLSC
ncbi:tol-pal system protein YbgF [Hansschlegelia sp. KR7-227]|jgi:tol-pal system protein YbgF|uniref:tol-pal system protein YbgF n=1 Tax=Hansschlegelia sp. KR7-227 TaxID=3400914 RepID=UPI003C043AC1